MAFTPTYLTYYRAQVRVLTSPILTSPRRRHINQPSLSTHHPSSVAHQPTTPIYSSYSSQVKLDDGEFADSVIGSEIRAERHDADAGTDSSGERVAHTRSDALSGFDGLSDAISDAISDVAHDPVTAAPSCIEPSSGGGPCLNSRHAQLSFFFTLLIILLT